MPVLGAVAAALALFATEVDRTTMGTAGAPSRTIAARVAPQPLPGGAYVSGLVSAIAPSEPPATNGPHHDGMSLRELRCADLSGQMTIPLLAGRF